MKSYYEYRKNQKRQINIYIGLNNMCNSINDSQLVNKTTNKKQKGGVNMKKWLKIVIAIVGFTASVLVGTKNPQLGSIIGSTTTEIVQNADSI